jgi:hypothetical protein
VITSFRHIEELITSFLTVNHYYLAIVHCILWSVFAAKNLFKQKNAENVVMSERTVKTVPRPNL